MDYRSASHVPSSNDTDVSTQYFVTDVSEATLVEIWNVLGPKPGRVRQLISLQLSKLFGKPLRFGTPISIADTQFISLDEIPDDARQHQSNLVQPVVDAGFVPMFAAKNDPTDALKGYCAFLRSADRMTVAAISRVQGRTITRTNLQLSSKRSNGLIIATNTSRRYLRLPPDIQPLNLPNANPTKVLHRHRRRIHELTDLILFTDDGARDLVREMSRRIVGYRVSTGLMVPATNEELQKAGLTP